MLAGAEVLRPLPDGAELELALVDESLATGLVAAFPQALREAPATAAAPTLRRERLSTFMEGPFMKERNRARP